jgi:hypothetical protein
MIWNKKKITFAVGTVFYGLSVAVKTWSLLFIPIFLKFIRMPCKLPGLIVGSSLTVLSILFIYSCFVFRPKFEVIFQAVLSAGGPVGIWGISYISFLFPDVLSFLTQNNLIIFVLLYIFLQMIILKSNISFIQTCFLTVLGIYIIIPNWGIQYLFWIMPFLYILKPQLNQTRINIFLIISSAYLFLNYLNNSGEKIIIPSIWAESLGFILWLFICYWFIYLLVMFKRTARFN